MIVPLMMCGSYSSRSSIVQSYRSRSSRVAYRCTRWASRSPYGIGWRTATTRLPSSFSAPAIARVVWLLPTPVRTAVTATTGTSASSIVASGPSRRKFAPAAITSEPLLITYSCRTSE